MKGTNYHFTPKQLDVLDVILRYRDEEGVSPTLQEVADELGLSKITIYEHVKNLEKKGAIVKERYRSRAYHVPEEVIRQIRTHPAATLPIAGGLSRETIEPLPTEREINLPGFLGADRAAYLLEVQEPIREASLLPGDLLVIERDVQLKEGATIVATVDERVFIRRYQREGDQIRLAPLDGTIAPPLLVDEERFVFQGIAISIVRHL